MHGFLTIVLILSQIPTNTLEDHSSGILIKMWRVTLVSIVAT